MDEKANYTKTLSSDNDRRSCDTKYDCEDQLKHVKERRSLEERVDNNILNDCDKNTCKGNLNVEHK